mmetsp:Transcript_34121/g.102999  ORF Transcript_34121/g.102999 Transcript_34121/m.102999 type:complete len:83 (-) Transcript_34121:203-451(-)
MTIEHITACTLMTVSLYCPNVISIKLCRHFLLVLRCDGPGDMIPNKSNIGTRKFYGDVRSCASIPIRNVKQQSQLAVWPSHK